MAFSFTDLNLGGVKPQENRKMGLPEGNHLVKVTGADLGDGPNKQGYTQLQLTVEGISVEGVASGSFALAHSGAEFQNKDEGTVGVNTEGKVVLGGLTNLRSLCEFGGHPNPKKPGDIKSLIGLKVLCKVVREEYEKDGETRKASRIFKYDPFSKPGSHSADPIGSGSSTSGSAKKADSYEDIFA